ncbi:hypothetical protein B0H11DRAFT_1919576 [Mycena galericulata]|nr:hypothetical protein B0H11DRAFT_1919576 [Mycena galericulata]
MPELKEVQVFRQYIQNFIEKSPPKSLKILNLYADAKISEQPAMKDREDALFIHAKTLPLKSTHSDRLRWTSKIFLLEKSIPDTHGLMVHPVWRLLPRSLRAQLSPNHPSWQSFLSAFEALEDNIITDPKSLPVPWHRLVDTSHSTPVPQSSGDSSPQSSFRGSSPLTPLPFDPMDKPLELPSLDNPFKIGESPSASCLVLKSIPQMPPTWRGPNLDPRSMERAAKADKCSYQYLYHHSPTRWFLTLVRICTERQSMGVVSKGWLGREVQWKNSASSSGKGLCGED